QLVTDLLTDLRHRGEPVLTRDRMGAGREQHQHPRRAARLRIPSQHSRHGLAPERRHYCVLLSLLFSNTTWPSFMTHCTWLSTTSMSLNGSPATASLLAKNPGAIRPSSF